MCGIAGIVGRGYDQSLVPSMLQVMRHRGPDSQGFYISDNIHIGHCRLSIIDLSDRAIQPFVSLDEKIAVAVNGEIYNFKEIKETLLRMGYKFRSDSDSEVILHAYIEDGLDFIRDLNGMFAISIWDERKRDLCLIRDRLGIKPLYYSKTRDVFLFASELKALALYDSLDLSVDYQSLAEYLAFENCFSNRTLNENIKLVEPGEIVRFNLNNESVDKHYFWQPDLNNQKKFDGDVYGKYMHVIESSVKRHLISDVPVGSYLSAGIDSSSVVYWSSKLYGNGLKTYSGYFGLSGFYDEATGAERIAKEFGCRHSRVEITPQDFISNIEKVVWHLDEPRVGMGSFSQYMVAALASKEVKVILTGHGGDEFFAGYPVFKAIFGKENIIRLLFHSSLRELMYAVYFSLYPVVRKEASYYLPNIFPLKSFKNLLKSDYYDSLVRNSDIYIEPEALKKCTSDEYGRLTLTYLKFYLPSLFIVEDKISMAFSLESRTPLCDNEMLDLALSIPLTAKLNNYELKHIPKKAMRGKLPAFVYNLPKRGFPTPLRIWFKKELRSYIKDFILDNISSVDIFNRMEVQKIIQGYQNTRFSSPFDEIEAHKIWIILNLLLYLKNQKQRYKDNTLMK